jgi:CelD/BcsL family acetyltransferase involved in cellulose biosynthesis
MSAGSTILGYLYNLVVGDRVFSYQSGFDYRHADLKPGIITHVMAIDHYLAGNVATYDLLEGESQYKRSLSHLSLPMYWLAVNPTLLRFRLESFLRNRIAKQKG